MQGKGSSTAAVWGSHKPGIARSIRHVLLPRTIGTFFYRAQIDRLETGFLRRNVQSLVKFLKGRVAVTGDGFQTSQVEEADMSTPVLDESLPLQFTGSRSDGDPLGGEYRRATAGFSC